MNRNIEADQAAAGGHADHNLWRGTAHLEDSEGTVLASGSTRLEALLNPVGTWEGELLADRSGLELPGRGYTLRCPEHGWSALVGSVECEPVGSGHGTTIKFRGQSVWPV